MSEGNPITRAFRKLRKEGLKGVFEALKWKFYRRKVMIVCTREMGEPLFEVKRLIIPKDMEVVLATLDHLDMMAANFPFKREWYQKRLETPGYYCSLAISDGQVLAHNWFCTCPHWDPEMRTWIRPEPGEAYWFEGWCTPSRRGLGIGHFGMKHCFEDVLPASGVQRIVTFLEPDNRATRKFHKRYGFQDVGVKTHLRLGPLYLNSKVKPLPAKFRD